MIKFDFVLNYELYSKIEDLANKKSKKVCEIVHEILIFMSSILQMKHLKEPRRESDYPVVDGKIRIRVALPEYLYNQLKMVHDHLNTFSMAVLVRELLITYFEKVEEKGEEEYKKEVEEARKDIELMRIIKYSWAKGGDPQDIPQKFTKHLFYSLRLDQNFCLREFRFL